MKKKMVLLTLLISAQTLAGQAYIPKFTHHSNGTWCTTISNISGVDVNVTVEAFKSDGSKYTGPSVGNNIPSQFNTPFVLLPGQTTLLCAKNVSGTSGHGFATIKGEAVNPTNGLNSFLLAHAYYHPSSSATYSRSIPVNAGMPF